MENSVHLSPKHKVRNNSKKNKEENITINSARYVSGFSVAITFSSGRTVLVNFLPLFEKYVKGENLKYFSPERFKKFIIKNGNIYWGRNEDIVFPASLLFKKNSFQKKSVDQILYII